jgi:hypothetical protein
MPPKP